MRLGKLSLLLATAVACVAGSGLAAAAPAGAAPAGAASAGATSATRAAQRTVSYAGVSLRVPPSWPVVNLARHPRACPRLDVHAVYLAGPARTRPARRTSRAGPPR